MTCTEVERWQSERSLSRNARCSGGQINLIEGKNGGHQDLGVTETNDKTLERSTFLRLTLSEALSGKQLNYPND